VRPLRGGVSSSVHLVTLKSVDGDPRAVVVRRYGEYWQRTDPAACQREFRLLELLTDSSIPAPRPLLLDVDGGPFGAPTVVMTRLPGRPLLAPRDLTSYVQQMAHTLAELHKLPTHKFGFLPDQADMVERGLKTRPALDDPLLGEVWAAAVTVWPRVKAASERSVLVHGDYWPGNLLWVRGRLVGVVDWEQPRLGDPIKDVATCRGDLWVLFGQAVADAFLAHYEDEVGDVIHVHDLRFWELFVSIEAVREMPEWAGGYRALGRPDLTAERATALIRAFARAALEGAASG